MLVFVGRRSALRCGAVRGLRIRDTRVPSTRAGSRAWRCVRLGRAACVVLCVFAGWKILGAWDSEVESVRGLLIPQAR